MNLKLLWAALLGAVLFFHPPSHNPGSQAARKAQPMDEWEALEISLRSAKSENPKGGFVPDEATAVRVGEAVAVAAYGEKTISEERPLRARLYGNFWLVKGTLHPAGILGGTVVIKVSKGDGKILFMMHQD